MKTKSRKHLIILLITDDLIHAKLMDGLSDLGLVPDNYSLNLSATIIKAMGFKGDQNSYVFEYYLSLLKRAKFIDNSRGNKEFAQLARQIYDNLRLQKPLPTKGFIWKDKI